MNLEKTMYFPGFEALTKHHFYYIAVRVKDYAW